MRPLLLCTDLDRTLIPNGRQPESPGVREAFAAFVGRDDVTLTYVTGRNRTLIQNAIESYGLPIPDFAIADVGTTIYRVDDHGWHHCVPWDDEISGDWQGHMADGLHRMLMDISGLRLQEAEKQNTHKLSYYVDLEAEHETLRATVEARLKSQGIRARTVWSIDEQQAIGLLDILPARASKRHAIEFMIEHGNYDIDHAVFAGDSGNDLEVLTSPIQAVLVANADADVRAALAAATPENVYVASGGFGGLNGNYAAGILEGVAHFRPEFAPIIEELIPR